jgi:hypothetical protein
VELVVIDASDYVASRSGLWRRGLLIRRAITDHELAFFSTWAPAGTSIEKPVRVEGCRWAIEDSFETAKNELDLDIITRPLLAWMPRLACHAGVRHDGHNPLPRQQDPGPTRTAAKDPAGAPLIRWSIQAA